MTQSDPRPNTLPERPTEAPPSPPPASGARSPIATTANGDLVEHTRDGIILAMHPADGRCPNCPPVPPKVRWHRVEVHSTSPDGETLDRAVEGDDAWVAASLRALADQLDPPKPPTRPTHRGGDVTNDPAARLRKPGTVSSPSAVNLVMQDQMPDASPVSRALAVERERRAGRGPDPMSFR